MLRSIFSFIFLFSVAFSFAQPNNDVLRSLADADLKPFYHGVASGDPTSNSVILWTRVTPEIEGNIDVVWKVSTDTTFSDTIAIGTFTTNVDRDYTVKVDVQGLQPGTFYYYEFTALDKNSLIGRTKTTPADAVDQLRFAVVSCSNYTNGYFNVYEKIYERNDVDAVIHLGDYIYEYGENDLLGDIRVHEPNREIVTLSDYRIRHALHKLDGDSRKMHQNFPIIATWDDHESANNSWRDGANNHSPNSEGTWTDRKSFSMQAYYEWMPIRLPDEENFSRIWRKISYGDLADLFMIDTRIYDRDKQDDPDVEEKRMIGPEQMGWLQTSLSESTAKWKIIGQQVVMAPLVVPNYATEEILLIIADDHWQGYTAERRRLYDHILENEIDNVVVLTGDIHTAWANDLPYDIFDYNGNTGEGSVAVEFVCTSVTTTSSPIALPPVYDIIRNVLPYIKYVELSKKGYTILDLTDEKAQGDFYTINKIIVDNTAENYQTGWEAADGIPHLTRSEGATIDQRPIEPVAPCDPRAMETEDTSIVAVQDLQYDILGVYPNPFVENFIIEVHLFKEDRVKATLIDTKGGEVIIKDFGRLTRGRNLLPFHQLNLPSGIYELMLSVGDHMTKRSLVKIE